jgi:adenylate kinase
MALKQALIFLGPPGAGKGTQSKRMAERCGVPHLSTGDMFRDAVSRRTALGRRVRPMMERGELVPDDVVMQMVEERLAQSDCARGAVFDGFPRTEPQAEGLETILESKGFGKPLVVDFCIAQETLLRRIAGRWTCSVGGEIYNIYEAPPKVVGVCDVDGGVLVQRADDRAEVVRERLAAYERQTKPVADYYRRLGVLQEVDASASVDEVSRALAKIVNCADGSDGRL